MDPLTAEERAELATLEELYGVPELLDVLELAPLILGAGSAAELLRYRLTELRERRRVLEP